MGGNLGNPIKIDIAMKFHLRDLCWLMLVVSLAAFCFKQTRENYVLRQDRFQRIVRELRAGEESMHGSPERFVLIDTAEQSSPLPVADR